MAWVPDNCAVRDKMLYTSSREDVKKGLGLSFFVNDYYANDKTDFNFDTYLTHTNRQEEQFLSEKETLMREEHRQGVEVSSHATVIGGSLKSSGMNMVRLSYG